VRAGREAAFLAPLTVRKLPGVGPRSAERLAAAGVETVAGLASLTDDELRALLPGKVGRLLRDRALGIDPRRLETSSERISISVEETFARDVDEPARLYDELRRMSQRLADHLRREDQAARTVTTKLRYADFSIRTRSLTLDVAVDDAQTIGDVACRLLDRALADRPGALRLVGVGLKGFETHRQLTLA
jgi:DNA polymerase-4